MTENHYNSGRGYGGGDKYLLLQSGYQPDQQFSAGSPQTLTATSPPSPTPCFALNHTEEEEDVMSATSKESYYSNRPSKMQYEFLAFEEDDEGPHQLMSSLAKRKVLPQSDLVSRQLIFFFFLFPVRGFFQEDCHV
jgi:hypothetical protein